MATLDDFSLADVASDSGASVSEDSEVDAFVVREVPVIDIDEALILLAEAEPPGEGEIPEVVEPEAGMQWFSFVLVI